MDTFHDVVVDDVDASFVGHGFEDGLVGCEVAEFDVGRHVLKQLESSERVVLVVGSTRDVAVIIIVLAVVVIVRTRCAF